jgi:hypothetical protein
MGVLSSDLKDLGYEPTDRESPFDDDGELWTNSFELVCDETGIVLRKGSERDRRTNGHSSDSMDTVYTYRNTDNAKLVGGHVSSYNWGERDGIFTYSRD